MSVTAQNFAELERVGYTVVPNVISAQECDAAIAEYQDWLKQFGDSFPSNINSIIKGCNTGHLETTWKLRLKTKPVYAQLWKTDKLLTSFDSVSIGRPPEDGEEAFQVDLPSKYWLHIDQSSRKKGLHAYQGTLYLEAQDHDDWTFQVMEGSHLVTEKFWDDFETAALKSAKGKEHYRLSVKEQDYFRTSGCRAIRVPAPKGSMVFWDSRLVHANARPIQNRTNAGRWRWVTFVSMTPAIWASPEDMAERQRAYREARMSSHWSSQSFSSAVSKPAKNVACPTSVPICAQTDEARKLSGDVWYDFEDGQPNGDGHVTQWKEFDAALLGTVNLGRRRPPSGFSRPGGKRRK